MNPEDKAFQIQRYEQRLRQHGYSPKTLGWGEHGRQEVRFKVLGQEILLHPNASVLDVGCGFADFYAYLQEQGWHGTYTGLDIVDGLLKVAREKYPDLDLRTLDIMDAPEQVGDYDFVVASGVFNLKMRGDTHAYIADMLRVLHSKARVATCVDFLSSYVDFQKEGAHHTDPAWALTQAMTLSKRVELRHDYMPFEFALTVYKDYTRNDRNVFVGFE